MSKIWIKIGFYGEFLYPYKIKQSPKINSEIKYKKNDVKA